MGQLDSTAAWNLFLETGKVEDYLQYTRAQAVAGAADTGEGAGPDEEDDNGRAGNRHAQF